MDHGHRTGGSIDGRIEQAKTAALGSHDSPPSVADEIGEAAGGISGTLLGAGVGAAAGPIGLLIGGIAGALGGWWAGRAVAEAAETLGEDDESYYRQHFHSRSGHSSGRSFDEARNAYLLGYIASHNPNFVERQFEEVEPELQKGWDVHAQRYGTWQESRPYVREAFDRGRERRTNATLADQILPHRPDERRS